MSNRITPDMLISKFVFDSKGEKIGHIKEVIREKYEKLSVDFLEITLDKKVPWGPRDTVKIRTVDAQLLKDGNIRVKYSKSQIKTMAKEQELQKHPPTV